MLLTGRLMPKKKQKQLINKTIYLKQFFKVCINYCFSNSNVLSELLLPQIRYITQMVKCRQASCAVKSPIDKQSSTS